MPGSRQKQTIAIIIPTYNERGNIVDLMKKIKSILIPHEKYDTHIVVVDDHSPDGTAYLVKQYGKTRKNIHLIEGDKQGLGIAYKRGFNYALNALKADTIIQMDSDFSHNPQYIPPMLQVLELGADVALGSRYIKGGSLPPQWSTMRWLNSKIANLIARWFAGLYPIHDCTSGFKAIKSEALEKVFLNFIPARGFSFQIRLLDELVRNHARIVEVPIHFEERTSGKSKMSFHDISEFIYNALRIRLKRIYLGFSPFAWYIVSGIIILLSAISIYLVTANIATISNILILLFLLLSVAIVIQSIFTLTGMMFAWDDPARVEQNQSPKSFYAPLYSFTAIVPALHEKNVIAETMQAIAQIEYPEHLTEIIIVCRSDDHETIEAVQHKIKELGKTNIQLLVPTYVPKNKPDKLNFALEYAHHDIVCVFDAEDSPHADIYQVINTVMIRDDADVVQSGVQLINFRSNWFSTLNVLEYFFWFKSVLHFFALRHVIPLGGNTVFFKREWLHKIEGWDANCLTEDADIGIKLSAAGAKIRIIYDEIHATQEETPETLGSFIKQRTRWNQGFLQVFKKKEWKNLPLISQRFFVAYMLIWPEIQAFLFIYIIASIVMIFTVKLPILVTLLSILPLYMLVINFIVLNIGLYEFTKKYNLKYPRWIMFKLLITFLPYQIILGYSSLRAVVREMRHKNTWEKTAHVNAHRAVQRTSPTSI
ncbi:MAG: glycosyltransferase [Candidatus Magasanikbacteria bacterium]